MARGFVLAADLTNGVMRRKALPPVVNRHLLSVA